MVRSNGAMRPENRDVIQGTIEQRRSKNSAGRRTQCARIAPCRPKTTVPSCGMLSAAARARLRAGPGGDPPGTPRMRSAPRGGTAPAHRPLTGPEGPVRWAGSDRLAVGPAAVPAGSTGPLAGPEGPDSLAGNDRLAVTQCRYKGSNRWQCLSAGSRSLAA